MTRAGKSGGKMEVGGKAGGWAVALGLVAGSVTATERALYCKFHLPIKTYVDASQGKRDRLIIEM
jgi:hypothetical protein